MHYSLDLFFDFQVPLAIDTTAPTMGEGSALIKVFIMVVGLITLDTTEGIPGIIAGGDKNNYNFDRNNG